MTTTTDYRASSHTMMAQSRDELAKGDLQQASEKGWGAAAQMMKADTDTCTRSPAAYAPRSATGTSTDCSTPPARSTKTSMRTR